MPTPEDGDEFAVRLGGLLRARREDVLHLPVAELARQTKVARTYIHDCEAGRKFASRSYVESLASLDAADIGLVATYENLASRRARQGRSQGFSLAEQLTQDLNEGFTSRLPTVRNGTSSIPPNFTTISGYNSCIGVTLNLLLTAATRPASVLVVNVDSLQKVAGSKFGDALADVLAAGWEVIHIFRPTDDLGERAELVLGILRYAGLAGRYRPIMVDASPLNRQVDRGAEFVAAQGVGAMQFINSDTSLFFPWNLNEEHPVFDETARACEALLSQGRAFEAIGTQMIKVWAGDNGVGDPDRPVPGKVAFDIELTQAESHPGPRVLVKSGVCVATMPPPVAMAQAERWKAKVGEVDAGYITLLVEDRLRRWASLRTNATYLSRDVCTKSAIATYLGNAPEPEDWIYQHEPLYSGKFLTREDRIKHVQELIDLINDPSNMYHLGLADCPEDLSVPVGNSYFEVTKVGVFFLTFSERDGHRSPLYGKINEPTVIEAFFKLAEKVWDELPDKGRDQDAVVAWLQGEVDKACSEVSERRSDADT